MKDWSLPKLFESLHSGIENELAIAREAFAHAPTKGDVSQNIWIKLLNTYLPKRYATIGAHIVDSNGTFSDQIDVVILDRQYSPFIFTLEGHSIIPAESVYAVFEAKQTVNAALVKYTRDKVASVRKLHRTSISIPHAGGTYDPKPLPHILGGILTLESEWTPPLGDPFAAAIAGNVGDEVLDLGCIAVHGIFRCVGDHAEITPSKKAATVFLLELIAQLQELATVPMIDIRAYARWLDV
jgi:hypothetical protein